LALVSWSYLTGMNVPSFPSKEVCTKLGTVHTSEKPVVRTHLRPPSFPS
jgi:hypothetical protein